MHAAVDHILNASSCSMTIAFIAIVLSLLYFYVTNRKLPPGPVGLPYFGYWPFLDGDRPHKHLKQLGDKYGDLYSITITGQLCIHIGSLSAIREVMVKKSACLKSRCTKFNLPGNLFRDGIGFASGTQWEYLRKFFTKNLRDYGFLTVMDDMELAYYGSVNATLEDLKAAHGSPVDLVSLLLKHATSTTRRIMFCDYDLPDEDFMAILHRFAECMPAFAGTNIVVSGQVAKHVIFPFYGSYRKYTKSSEKLFSVLRRIVADHDRTLNEECPRNILDRFLVERKERERQNDPAAAYFTNEVLMYSLAILITDGSYTITEFVALVLHTLAKMPEEQEKIYRELLDVVGDSREPTLQDKNRLPYSNAFLLEVLRTAETVPYYISMEFTSETELRGYTIPKGSLALVNNYAINRNTKSFDEPDKFDPSRYMPTSERKRADLPVQFGVGKHSCFGEAFAMTHLFLFLVTVVKNFKLTFPEGTNVESMKWMGTNKADICAHPRSQD